MTQEKRGHTQRQQVPETVMLTTEQRLSYLANLIVDLLEMELSRDVQQS